MNDWLNKFFAVFTMYKSQKAADELESPEENFIEEACLHCGAVFKLDIVSADVQFCPHCGNKLTI